MLFCDRLPVPVPDRRPDRHHAGRGPVRLAAQPTRYFVVAPLPLRADRRHPLRASSRRIYYWYPEGDRPDARRDGSASWHFWLFVIGFHLTFDPMHIPGMLGMPRRIYTYEPGRGWDIWNLIVTIGVALPGRRPSLIFVWNLVRVAAGRASRPATTRGTPGRWNGRRRSPPPAYNFATIPTVAQPPAAVGPEASGRSGLEVRANEQPCAPDATAAVPPERGRCPTAARSACACLIIAESAIFTIFVVAYLFYLGKSLTGPTPRDVLELPIFITLCLLVEQRDDSLRRCGALAHGSRATFPLLWLLTIALALVFHRRHGARVAPADRRARPDDPHEPVRHDLLLAGRPARLPRHRRPRSCLRRRAGVWRCAGKVAPRARAAHRRARRSTGTSSTPCGSSSSRSSTSSDAEQDDMRRHRARRGRRACTCPRRRRGRWSWRFGVTLLFAGLLTQRRRSACSAPSCSSRLRRLVPRGPAARARGDRAGRARCRECPTDVARRASRSSTSARSASRAWLPVQTYPVSAGVKGGLAGSVAMAVLACALRRRSSGQHLVSDQPARGRRLARVAAPRPAEALTPFHADGLLLAIGDPRPHVDLVGLLYGAMLPMFPRRPILLGG